MHAKGTTAFGVERRGIRSWAPTSHRRAKRAPGKEVPAPSACTVHNLTHEHWQAEKGGGERERERERGRERERERERKPLEAKKKMAQEPHASPGPLSFLGHFLGQSTKMLDLGHLRTQQES